MYHSGSSPYKWFMQVRVIGARSTYCVSSPAEQNHEFGPLYKFHIWNLWSLGFLSLPYTSINSPFLDIKIAGLSKWVIEKKLRHINEMQIWAWTRRVFYCVSSPVCRTEAWISHTLQNSCSKSMVYTLSCDALFKYEQAISGHAWKSQVFPSVVSKRI